MTTIVFAPGSWGDVFHSWLALGHASFFEPGDVRWLLALVWLLPIVFIVVMLAWVCGVVNNWRRK